MTSPKFKFSMSVTLAALMTVTASAQDVTLDEIIVTAQKREQNIQDVPVSVATLDDEELRNIFQAGEDIRALAVRVPGLYAESSNGRVAPRFYIRGLGNTDFDLAASQPVSVIMDDVVMENVVLKSFPLFDVDRVEVLRGPQGTLFGRNTPAGLVKFDTVKPSEDFGGYGTVSYGTLGSFKLEGAVGGALGDGLSARVSGLFNSREDYIDNGFTGQEDVFGDYTDIAGRLQVMYAPDENLDVLLNVHARDLDATSALFRANILTPGSNDLNQNFDRDRVFFDGGNGNEQEYSQLGGSLKVNYTLGNDMTFTSITAYETADGVSRGDIDGGSGAVFLPGGSFPGFIPFPSDTQDGVDDLDQFTQEFRLAGNGGGNVNWQVGFYYFDSKLQITTNPFFVPATTVRHDNTAWAIFGQAEVEVADGLTATGGIRYTDDSKDFEAVAANFPVAPVSVSDDQISWDLSLTKSFDEGINVYGRIARGFRAPTIQGRDVAFFGSPTTATSETINSYEIGLKSLLLDNRLRFNAALFHYDASDLQFSAIGGLGNFNQLVNADGKGTGFEVDAEFRLNEFLSFSGGISHADTRITESGLQVAPCGGGCTVLDPVDLNGLATVEGNPFPQAPDWTYNASVRWDIPAGDDNFYFIGDFAKQGYTNFFLYESAEFFSDGNEEFGARFGYEFGDGKYDAAIFARNITNEDNLKGGIDFNNLTGFVNEPRVIGAAFTGRF